MENTTLVGLSRQMVLRREMDVIANNIANIGTTGFKADQMLFDDYLMPVARAETFERPDRRLAFVVDWATVADMTPGPQKPTGNPLDLAIADEGFFVVQTPGGERYTRNGAFGLASDGTLVTNEGYPVLGEGGPIRFAADELPVSVSGDGTVATPAGVKDRLRIAGFDDPRVLKKEGVSLFASDVAPVAATPRIVQGSIEGSNVSGVGEIARMVQVTRSYESLAGLMSRLDDIRRSAIERLGSVSA